MSTPSSKARNFDLKDWPLRYISNAWNLMEAPETLRLGTGSACKARTHVEVAVHMKIGDVWGAPRGVIAVRRGDKAGQAVAEEPFPEQHVGRHLRELTFQVEHTLRSRRKCAPGFELRRRRGRTVSIIPPSQALCFYRPLSPDGCGSMTARPVPPHRSCTCRNLILGNFRHTKTHKYPVQPPKRGVRVQNP